MDTKTAKILDAVLEYNIRMMIGYKERFLKNICLGRMDGAIGYAFQNEDLSTDEYINLSRAIGQVSFKQTS